MSPILRLGLMVSASGNGNLNRLEPNIRNRIESLILVCRECSVACKYVPLRHPRNWDMGSVEHLMFEAEDCETEVRFKV